MFGENVLQHKEKIFKAKENISLYYQVKQQSKQTTNEASTQTHTHIKRS